MNETFNTFGETLTFYRKQKGYTQQQIADILGINRTTYTKYETSVTEPSIETLRHLSQLLDVDFNALLGMVMREKDVHDEKSETLSPEELALVQAYRRLSPQQQEELRRQLNLPEE